MKTHSLSLSELQNLIAGTAGICKFVMAGANGYSCRYPNGVILSQRRLLKQLRIQWSMAGYLQWQVAIGQEGDLK